MQTKDINDIFGCQVEEEKRRKAKKEKRRKKKGTETTTQELKLGMILGMVQPAWETRKKCI